MGLAEFAPLEGTLRTGRRRPHLFAAAADADKISELIFIAANHDPRVLHIESLVAYYHVGTNVIAEVDIVLPAALVLTESHDIGQSLQVGGVGCR